MSSIPPPDPSSTSSSSSDETQPCPLSRDPSKLKAQLLGLHHQREDMPGTGSDRLVQLRNKIFDGDKEAVQDVDEMLWGIQLLKYQLGVIVDTDYYRSELGSNNRMGRLVVVGRIFGLMMIEIVSGKGTRKSFILLRRCSMCCGRYRIKRGMVLCGLLIRGITTWYDSPPSNIASAVADR